MLSARFGEKHNCKLAEIFKFMLGVGDKTDCLKKGPRLIGGMPSVGVFLRDLSPYLREFRRKPWKTLNG